MSQGESYQELLEQMKIAKPGKECQILHKKLKRYGSGMFFRDRYPNFDILVSIVALAVSLTVFILRCFGKGC